MGCSTARAFVLGMLSLAALTEAPPATAETTVEVLDTEPATLTAILGSDQTFYMRIAYATDTPVRIWARPYYQGREVNAGSNPSRVHEGEGEALCWFFFLGEPGQQADEIRISAGDGSSGGTRELVRLPVRITAGTQPAPATVEPAWLARLRAEEERLQREDYERRMSEPASAGDYLFGAGFMLAVLVIGIGGIALPATLRQAASRPPNGVPRAPAAWVGFVVLRIVLGTALDPTSHNLWPFEILYASVVSLLLLGAMAVARRFVAGSRSAADSASRRLG